jgi:plasmid stability protein
VATLNIKHLPDALYERLKDRAKCERRSVAQEVIGLLSDALETPPALSIMELQGLGVELWRGVDATSHVESERKAWD